MDEGSDAVIGRQGLKPKGVARRQEILDRAIDVFRERGSDGTSLRRIAEALGVSHAALLHYFDSREQLLVAVYAEAEGRRAETDAALTGADSLIHAATANAEVPGLVKLYTTLLAASLESADGVGAEYFSTRFDRLRSRLTSEFEQEQAAGRMRDDIPAAHIATLFIAASDGLQAQWLLEPSVGLETTLRSFAAMLRPSPTSE